VSVCAALPLLVSPDLGEPEKRDIYIRAKQYNYDPHRIVVDRGDEVHLRLASMDVVHGFFLEGHNIEAMIYPGKSQFYLRHPSIGKEHAPVEEVVFTASRSGKFRYRCSITCGTLHPFMLGEMIVKPNYPFLAGVGGVWGVFLAGFILMFLVGKNQSSVQPVASPHPWRLDLLKVIPGLNWLVRRRWLQFALVLPMLAFFFLFLIAGFFGSPIGNRNIIMTFVWILWWFLLISFMLPFGSRVWCLMCPFPFFGEWFQRRRLLGPGPCNPDAGSYPMSGLNKKWPAALSNIWLQNLLFLALCTFSAVLITRPVVTALALGSLAIIATAMHLIYRRRTFCNYVCPVSGFLGLYAMASMIEVRPKDPDICATCKVKAGLVGNEQGWACPWSQNPSKMARNNYCGLCMECIRACPNECMTLRARPFCSDVQIKGYDEAWKAFIMITIALVYSVTLLGPWGTFKEWANISEVGNWNGFLTYTGVIWFTSLAGIPALWAIAACLGRRLSGTRSISAKEIFLRYTYLLVPLGLVAWIAFSIPLILVNSTCILNTMSDPMGWGWDLCGTAHLAWKPIFPEYAVYVQIPLLLIGLGFSLKRGYEIAQGIYGNAIQGVRSLIPVGIVCTCITMVFLTLFAG
jgi:hypothetical protein